jgi:CRP-like cAMP-binding protein
VLAWAQETFNALCERFPRLRQNSLEILDERLKLLEERFLELATESADTRLARMLMRLLDRKEGPASQPAKISFSNLELAQMTGMSQFTVNRLLSSWQQCEIVKRQRKAVYVLDLARLTDLAGKNTVGTSPERAMGTRASSPTASQPAV